MEEALAVSEFNALFMARTYLMDVAQQCAEELGVESIPDAIRWEKGDQFTVSDGVEEYSGCIAVLKTFVQAYLDGEASIDDLDKYIEFWHTHETGNKLHEFLGVTSEEYARLAKASNDEWLQEILAARKEG